jgi:pyrimidine-nucleoside phosphorylase
VTATVDELSLISASIMSKKIAAGAQAIVLDVKVGDGAFMKTIEDARALAETMAAIGRHAGREVTCLLTDMDQPLGAAVGNALEVREARETINGRGPSDFAPTHGYVTSLSAIGIGNAAVHLGAGRRTKEDEIDHAVGIVVRAKRGDHVAVGDTLAEAHVRTEEQARAAAEEIVAAYEFGDIPPHARSVLLEVI